VSCLPWAQGVVGSNPIAPTISSLCLFRRHRIPTPSAGHGTHEFSEFEKFCFQEENATAMVLKFVYRGFPQDESNSFWAQRINPARLGS